MKIKISNGFIYNLVIILCWPIFKILYRFEVSGSENIPKKGKCIICPNHTSNADAVLLVLAFGRKVFFMAKAELFKNRIFAFLFRYFGAFPVNRGKSDRSAIEKSTQVLKENKPLAIFIEGTRSLDGELLKPKSGAAMIALKTNTPVLPVCITPVGGGKVKFFKKVNIKFGEQLSIDDLGLKDGTPSEFRNASRLIMEKIKVMKG